MTNIGRYEIRGELGRGAMAIVWDAWDPVLLRHVAIKELSSKPGTQEWLVEEMGKRFVQEGRLAARLVHPNIITIHEADELDGRSIIVMEKLEGTTLSQLIDQRKLSAERIWDILSQLMDAIVYAHSLGVVHRDIKPDNIFITHQGLVKLTDFGIAGLTTMQTEGEDAVIAGSPGYMAPEQAEGKATDARTDVFSFSVVAYEMLALDNPFGATSDANREEILMRTSAAGELKKFIEIPAMSEVILKGMNPDPKNRYQDSEKYRKALNAAFERERYAFLSSPKGKPFVVEGATKSYFDAININLDAINIKAPQSHDDKGRFVLIAVGVLALLALLCFVADLLPLAFIAIVALLAVVGYWMYMSSKRSDATPVQSITSQVQATPNDYKQAPDLTGGHEVNLRITLPTGEVTDCSLTIPSTIGRDCMIGSCVLDDPTISRDHLLMDVRDGQLVVRDLGSFNGTQLNDLSITGEHAIKPGDRLALGSTRLDVL